MENKQKRAVLAVDIGGSKLIVGLVDEEGHVLDDEQRNWSELTQEGILRDILAATEQVLSRCGNCVPVAVGLNVPGLADPRNGLWVEASFSGIRDFPIAARLHQALSLPVWLDNDVNACALAERRWGCCQDADDFIWITVSNGIGSAVFANGQPFTGHSGNAGEVGHIVAVEGDRARPCGCGHSGCFESHASGRGLHQNYLDLCGDSSTQNAALDAKKIADLARAGDSIALATFRLEGEYLGKLAALCANLLNPRKIVFGGGVLRSADLFWETLLSACYARVYRGANPELSIECTALGYHAALLGAASLAFAGMEHA